MGVERTQESLIHLDTHVALWLYDKVFIALSKRCKQALSQSQIYISPMVLLEMQYLYEIQKLIIAPNTIIRTLVEDLDLKIANEPFDLVAQYAIQNTWTRDPFDRIIVAQAQVQNALLATIDKKILKNYKKALI